MMEYVTVKCLSDTNLTMVLQNTFCYLKLSDQDATLHNSGIFQIVYQILRSIAARRTSKAMAGYKSN
jgi:hypothetical protein